jgi:colicin import membrane protein
MSTENQVVEVEEVDTNEKKNRSFKVKLSEEGVSYGRYNGDSPYQAANKALSEIIRNKVKAEEAVEGKLTFWLIESTKGSSKRVHQYEGERIKLAEPVKYKVGENEIVKEYKNILKKIKKADQVEVVTKKATKKATKKVAKKATKKVAKVATKATKATKATTKVAKATTKVAKATTKAAVATPKATKATTKATKATTKATKATTKTTKKAKADNEV